MRILYPESKEQMKTEILMYMAGENYWYFDESELMEMFNLKDSDIDYKLYTKCLNEYADIYDWEEL